ncbi:MAG: glycosaminoglycan attachment site [Marinobacter sp.]|jgi:hypothetical protein|nr:glycosaminoglycan attachment site [Marinobacter sp.]
MTELPLFTDVAKEEAQHPIYKMIRDGDYEPERKILLGWSDGFVDRDGKFCHEFQTSFEPCLWELYIHAFLKEIKATIDFKHDAPDFVVNAEQPFCIEATISAPAQGGQPAHGFSMEAMPDDFNRFNQEATVRLCNSFTSKVRKLRERYSKLPQSVDKPFIIAIASFDRPFSHMSAMRPVISALYGLYHDEMETIATGSSEMVSYNVDTVIKNENTKIDLGYFCSPEYSDVSAVIFSSLATWGKVRAVADNPNAKTVYTTYHPNPGSLEPIIKQTKKSEYCEHLLDGLCILHNPFAKKPLKPGTLSHERLAQGFVKSDGELDFEAPDDFLLMRSLMSIKATGK